MALTSGTRLGPYEILNAIGAGGMGHVYKARDSRLDRLVAIKILPEEFAADAGRRERFEREARAVAALNHPHICDLHDVGEIPGLESLTETTRFLVMEFLEGTTLADRLVRGPLPTSEVQRYAVELADALDHAHRRGVIHRDLKPGNVMLTTAGAKLLDFGLSRREASPDLLALSTLAPGEAPLTAAGTVLGTYPYMAPEQLTGREADARSDLFAFGAIVYEMATGRRAFAGTTAATVIGAILHTDPPPVSSLQSLSPPALDRVVARCLAKDPDDRWQSARDLTFELRGIADNDAGVTPAARSRATSHPSVAWTVVAIGGLIAAVSAGAWWLTRDRVPVSAGSTAASSSVSGQATPPEPASALRVSVGGPASSNPEANRYFENAMQARLAADVAKERQMLERALELDPHFAEARARYGFTNWLLIDGGQSNDGALLYKAEDELRRALQDEPTLGRAHAFFAAIYLTQGRKELVPAELDLAQKMSPDDEDTLHWLFQYHNYSGDDATASRVAQRNLERHPLFFPTRMVLGDLRRRQGDLAASILEQERILEQDPQSVYAISNLGRTYLDSGDLAKARQTLNRARPDDRQNFWLRLFRGTVLALEGHRNAALEEVDGETLKWGSVHGLFTSEIAEFYASLGDGSKALEWLDLAVRNGDERVEWFRRDPLFANIREHPQFQLIVQSADYSRKQRKR
jgi:serine/threonine protein kinase/tetratricopeptide (TPR) repeat protein